PIGLIALAAGVLLLVWVAGYGWASTLLGTWLRPFEIVAIAPAIGTAVVVLVGVVAAPFGIRPGGWGALAIAGIAVLGGAVVPFRRRGERRRGGRASEPTRASRPKRFSEAASI